MKVRTATVLQRKVDADLGWRKKELTASRFIVESAGASDARVLCRAGVVLMYSHWEGFIKEAARVYAELVSSTPRRLSGLASPFRAMALRSEILQLGSARTVSAHHELIERIRNSFTDNSSVRVKAGDGIAARSNLDAARLRVIIGTLGLDYSPFELKEKQVITRLVKLRHKIAHGAGAPVDLASFKELHSETVTLLGCFRDQVVDAAIAEAWNSPDPGYAI